MLSFGEERPATAALYSSRRQNGNRLHKRIVLLVPGTFLMELLFAAAHFHFSSRRLLYLIDGIQEKME